MDNVQKDIQAEMPNWKEGNNDELIREMENEKIVIRNKLARVFDKLNTLDIELRNITGVQPIGKKPVMTLNLWLPWIYKFKIVIYVN